MGASLFFKIQIAASDGANHPEVMNIVILALASLGGSGANFLGDASILRMARLVGCDRRQREQESPRTPR